MRAAFLLAILMVASCVDQPEPGTEGGPCDGNGTCNRRLVCLSDLCVEDPNLNRGEGEGEGEGEPTQVCVDGGPRADILFVVDNSESMASEQQKLVGALGRFLRPLIASGLDYQIGVVTTDPAENGVLRAYPGSPVSGCAGCRILTSDVACADAEVSVADLSAAERETLLAQTCEAWLVLGSLILAGTDGASFEEGFAQAATALGAFDIDPVTGLPLGNVPAENAGFRREGAPLHLIFVSDEDEGAKRDGVDIRFYERLFTGVLGPGDQSLVRVSTLTGWAIGGVALESVCPILSTGFNDDPSDDHPQLEDVRTSLAEFENGCVDESGGPGDLNVSSEVGSRYIELACRLDGFVGDLCESDFSLALSSIAEVVLDQCVVGACIRDADCPNGLCARETSSCVSTTQCAGHHHCPFGFICASGLCVAGCAHDGDCVVGEPCIDGQCDPTPGACNQTGDCKFGQTCALSNTCTDHPDSNILCQRCAGDDPLATTCGSGFCLIDPTVPAPLCTTDTQCDAGYCVKFPCASDGECPPGETCESSSFFGGTCTGHCGDFFCGNDACDDVSDPCPRGYSCVQVIAVSSNLCTRGGGECASGSTCSADRGDESTVSGSCSCLSDADCSGRGTCSSPGPSGACIQGNTCVPSGGLTCEDVR